MYEYVCYVFMIEKNIKSLVICGPCIEQQTGE